MMVMKKTIKKKQERVSFEIYSSIIFLYKSTSTFALQLLLLLLLKIIEVTVK